MSTTAVSWALNRAPMPKSDPTARLVLAYLAEKADKSGRNAYPQVLTMAHDLDLNWETVKRALKRLRDTHGLVSKDGTAGSGAVRYRLHLEQVRAEGSYDAFAAEQRAAKSTRQKRWRAKQVDDDGASTESDVDDSRVSTVDDSESSQPADVDDDGASRRRLSLVSKTTDRRLVDDAQAPRNRQKNHQNRHKNPRSPWARSSAADAADGELDLPGIEVDPKPTSKPAPAKRGYTEAFESAWQAYGRRGTKKDAFTEWQKAVKRADPAVIAAAIPAYVASTSPPVSEIKYRKHMENWLKKDGWESAVVPAAQAAGGHQPYRNPADQSAYDEPLIAPRRSS